VLQSARRPSRFAMKKGNLMKSRAALVAILALGVFMSGTGATLAVSGFARSGSASSAQYPVEEHNTKPKHTPKSRVEGATSSHELGPEETSVQPVEAEAVRQVASTSGGSLPFTGFVAIPVLIVGIALLGAGALLRFRSRRDDLA
jgi:hypothetical protein